MYLAKVGILLNTAYGPTVIYSLRYCCVAETSYYRSGFTWNNLILGLSLCLYGYLAMITGINFSVGGVGNFICGISGTVETSYGPSEHTVADLEKSVSWMFDSEYQHSDMSDPR